MPENEQTIQTEQEHAAKEHIEQETVEVIEAGALTEKNEITDDHAETPEPAAGHNSGSQNGGRGTSVNVMAGMSFTLLKVKFMAGFEKDSEGFRILLLPTNQEENTGMTVKEMIADVKKLMRESGAEPEDGGEKMEQDITAAIEGVSDPDDKKTEEEKKGFDPMKLRICLRQAFLYYRKAGDQKTFEYAFKLEIDAKDMLPDIGLVSLDNLSIAVWSTDRKKILDDMGLFHMDEILKEYA